MRARQENALDWTERILAFPVRTAAVDAFLSELKTKRSADLNGVLVTLNDGNLCRLVLQHWVSNGWIVVAPHSPLVAMAGPAFTPDLKLKAFCGAPIMAEDREEPGPPAAPPETIGPTGDREDATK